MGFNALYVYSSPRPYDGVSGGSSGLSAGGRSCRQHVSDRMTHALSMGYWSSLARVVILSARIAVKSVGRWRSSRSRFPLTAPCHSYHPFPHLTLTRSISVLLSLSLPLIHYYIVFLYFPFSDHYTTSYNSYYCIPLSSTTSNVIAVAILFSRWPCRFARHDRYRVAVIAVHQSLNLLLCGCSLFVVLFAQDGRSESTKMSLFIGK